MHLSLQTDYGLRVLMLLASTDRQMSVDEIARRLQQILADDALRERLIAAGTRQVQRFLWRDAAAKMLALAQDAQPRTMPTAVAHLDG